MNDLSDIVEEQEEIIRILGELKHVSCYDYSQVMHQTATYLDNHQRLTQESDGFEEFSVDKFLKIDSKDKPGYYRFKKPAGLSMADIAYRLFIEIPAIYGVMTGDGPVAFGNDLTVAIANSLEDKIQYTDVNVIDDKTFIKIILDYENLPINLLRVEDIDCMRMDWIGWLEEAIDRFELQYLIISDLSLIYRPQIYPKLVRLARESNVNIIGFVNSY
ncbi:MAG: hypothetical protein H8E14_08330 [Candidatus Marinimicrobia bacterium]|nr:hypothetical protein [Candidatus Neomarinimicrobiota bacterium]